MLYRLTIPALFLHLAGTALPLAFTPGDLFCFKPGAPLLTLECQYILKNMVLAAAALSLVGSRSSSTRIRLPRAVSPQTRNPEA